MKAIYIVCAIALLGAMMVAPAAAETWDVYEGDSIQDALNSASSGDTVFVHAGTYYELSGLRIYINKPNITLKGEGADVVTLDRGGGNGVIAIGVSGPPTYPTVPASGCIVEGFRITNCSEGVVVYEYAPNCIIRNNVIEDIPNGVATLAPNTTFIGNVVLNPENDLGGIGILSPHSSGCIIMDNVVSGATGYICAVNIEADDCIIVNNTIESSPAAGISVYMCANNTITRNNINSHDYAGIELYDAGEGNKIYLNNFVDNGVTVTTTWSTAPAVTYWNSTEPTGYTYNSNSYTNYLGNYWGSDYTGSDGDGDGIGTPPYTVPDGLGNDHRPLMEPFENYVSEEEPAPSPTPATPALISGSVSYDNGNNILNPTVTVRNIDTFGDFTVKTDAGSNYYRVLTDSSHVSAGNAILINASDGTVYNGATHIVTASEIETGGFMQDMILESGERPDLILTEKSEEWVTIDKTYTITYTVENSGTFNAGTTTTSIRIDGTEVAIDTIPALAIDENYMSTLGPFTFSGDNDTIEVCADSADVINELDETNNCLSNVLEESGLPDLTIRVALKTPGFASEDNILGVRVKNSGSGDAGSFDVSLSIDGTQVLLETVSSLVANEITELEYLWTPASTGEYALGATADTNNEVQESDETNNDYARTSVIIKCTDWPQFHYDEVHSGFSPCSAPDTNKTLWISDEINAIGGTSTVVADGMVFAYGGPTGWGSGDGTLYCFDQFTGNILWNVSIPTPAYGSWSSPAYHNGRVFTSTDIEAGCYDAATGEQIWAFENPTNEPGVNGGPVVADGKVIVNDWQAGHFYCLDEETGELLWTFTEEKTGGWGVGYAQGVPAYEDGKFYLTTWLYTGGNVYCVDADTGTEIWNKTFSLDTCGSPVVVDGTVYVSTYDFYGTGEIYALNAGNGDVLWQRTIQRSDSTPAVAYGNVYVTGGCKGYSSLQTYCFNAATGDLVWETDIADEIGEFKISVAVADGKVFVGRAATFFEYAGTVALDAFTGDEVWSYPQGGSSPAIADDIVFTIGGGKVYAFYTVPAGVTFDLKKLDLNSNGILKVFITLPEDYDVADIDVSTVECEGAYAFGDGNVISGKQALEVKFKIQDLVDVPTGDAVSLSVTGELTTGDRFEGSDTVEVIAK